MRSPLTPAESHARHPSETRYAASVTGPVDLPAEARARAETLEEGLTRRERRELPRGTTSSMDALAVEAPLEIRIGGVPIAILMRTPGADVDLAWGFLRSEGIVSSRDQVLRVRHCDQVDTPEAEDNVIEIRLAESAEVDLAGLRRNTYTTSSCGICGKASREAALAVAPPFDGPTPLAENYGGLSEGLRARQALFEATGAVHAAGLFSAEGELLCVREDVGRHNAVDKVIGACFREGVDPAASTLMVSGRVSFEVVQKCLAARIPAIAAVSAPTSLAVDLAREANMTLVGFVRGERALVYAGG
jgi:FdhD protein